MVLLLRLTFWKSFFCDTPLLFTINRHTSQDICSQTTKLHSRVFYVLESMHSDRIRVFFLRAVTYEAYLFPDRQDICKQGQLIVKVIESIIVCTWKFLFVSTCTCLCVIMSVSICVCMCVNIYVCMNLLINIKIYLMCLSGIWKICV